MIPLPVLVLAPFLFVAARAEGNEHFEELGRQWLERKMKSIVGRRMGGEAPPNNVILFIGDGMGIATVTAARIARNQERGDDQDRPFFFETFPFTAISKTSSLDKHTTDSAAGAMALMAGWKVEQSTLGRKPGFGPSCSGGAAIRDGVADLCLSKGLAVGLATTDTVTGATPAALYAKDVHRSMEATVSNGSVCTDIASQILEYPGSHFKVVLGGGRAQLLPKEKGGNRTDGRDITQEWASISPTRRLLTDKSSLLGHSSAGADQLLGLFSLGTLPYAIDEASQRVPRLADLAEKAVRQLQTGDKGYFLMVEGALIDKAEHHNEFRVAARELSEFDEAIERVAALVGEDTLIIVTADHAHALTLPGYLDRKQSIFERDTHDSNVTSIFFATGPGYGGGNRTNYTAEESRAPHFAQPAAFYMKNGAHGGEDVGVWAMGPYAWLFSGTMENTQVAYNTKFLLCLQEDSICDRKWRVDREEEWPSVPLQAKVAMGVLGSMAFLLSLLSLFLISSLIRRPCRKDSISISP